MQTPQQLLSSLTSRGVSLWIEDGQIRFRAPKGTLLPQERERLRELKAEVIGLLGQARMLDEVRLSPRGVDCPVPLTSLQNRVWKYLADKQYLTTRDCSLSMLVSGPLDACVLKECVESIVRRHESLRTWFAAVDGVPRQLIHTICDLQWEVIDLSSASEGLEAARRLAVEVVTQKISLSVGPLLVAKVFKLSSTEHVVLLAMNHMITDGVSNDIVRRELWTTYRRTVRGVAPQLPAVTLQFGDYAVWQEQTYELWRRHHEAYWRRRLSDAPCTKLPRDGGLQVVSDPVGAALEVAFDETLSAGLRDLAKKQRSPTSLIVLTIVVAAMIEWCDQPDELLLSFVTNGRYRPELENMVGFLASIIYLRVESSKDDTLLDLLRRVSEEFYAAADHHDFDRVSQIVPTCTTELHFNWLTTEWIGGRADDDGAADEVIVRPFRLNVVPPLLCGAWAFDTVAGIRLVVMYRPDQFSPSTIERFGMNLRIFAEAFVRSPLGRRGSITPARL